MPFRSFLAARWLGLRAPVVLAPMILLSLAPPAAAAPKHHAPAKEAPSKAKQLGKFDDWTAVTREEGGQTVCYAFTYPTASAPKLSGRGKPVLTVTERSSGRDAVAFSAGFAFAANAETNLQVEQTSLPFYTAGRFAFARDGAAAVEAFRKGREATMRSPVPRGAPVSDTFSLNGFSAAYDAITKACPAK
jgi:invasion protein IalB